MREQSKTYPYTYARVSAMKSKLLEKDAYHKLLKMEQNSIANFLAESEYQEAIDALGTSWSGTELIERALGLHLAQVVDKLRKVTPGDVHTILDAYSRRWDFENLKTMLRGLRSQTGKEQLRTLLLPAGTWNDEQREQLLDSSNPEELLDKAKLGNIKKQLSQPLAIVENSIDDVYYTELLTFTKAHGFASFNKVIRYEIDMLNVLFLLRQKIQGEEASTFITGGHFAPKYLQHLAEQSLEEIFTTLEAKGWNVEGKEDVAKEKTIRMIEIALLRTYLEKARRALHSKPLRASVIVGFLFAKEIEVKNLQIITKGKALGVKEEILEAALV